MEDMIAKILEMDEKAQELSEETQSYKVNFEQDLIAKKEEIKSRYLELARIRIEKNRAVEDEKAEKFFKEYEEKQKSVLKAMEDLYKQQGEEWVNQIFNRTIGV